MHNTDITLDSITKIEGTAKLDVKIRNGVVEDLKFIIHDYRRFYNEAIREKPYAGVPLILSRICGTCSMAHLFASIEAIEKALGIYADLSEQTVLMRKLSINGMMIRDHALHLYIFSLPDILGIDSVLDIDENNPAHKQLLHDAFDLKAIGNKLSTVFSGAAIHAPFPGVGGFRKIPTASELDGLIPELEASREKAIRAVRVFYDWDEELLRESDYMALQNDDFNFTRGIIKTMSGKSFPEEDFRNLLDEFIVPYSQSKSYALKESTGANSDFLVGSLARLNLNKQHLHPRTQADIEYALEFFPSNNIYDNCLAQAIEILHCIDLSIDLLKGFTPQPEKIPPIKPQAGIGVGVLEAPRGILYHKIELDEAGKVVDSDVIVPTSQNQIHIEASLAAMFVKNLSAKTEDELKYTAEMIIRAYDPCMSCATNFLQLNWL